MTHDILRTTVAHPVQRDMVWGLSFGRELLCDFCPLFNDITCGIRGDERKPGGGHIRKSSLIREMNTFCMGR